MRRSVDRAVWILLAVTLVFAGCSSSERMDRLASKSTTSSESVTAESAGAGTAPVQARTDPPASPEADGAPNDQQPADDLTNGATQPENPAPLVAPTQVKPRRIQNGTETITFDDLKIDMPVDSAFDPMLLTDRARELDHQKVRISGFIAPTIFQAKGIKSFPMLRNLECKFGPGGQAFCVIVVELKEGVTTNFTTKPVTVEGVLKIEPYGVDGITYALYHLDGEKVF